MILLRLPPYNVLFAAHRTSPTAIALTDGHAHGLIEVRYNVVLAPLARCGFT